MGIKNYGLITSIEELFEFTERVHGNTFGYDIETGYHGPDREKGSVHPETAILAGISFTDSTDWARYVPLGHDNAENLDNRLAAIIFWDLLNTGQGVAHNAAFELRHLARWFREHLSDDPLRGEAVRASQGYYPIRSDTLVEAYLVAEFERFGLKSLTNQLFGHTMTELYDLFTDLPVNRRKFLRFNVLPLEPRVVEYACEDSVWCLAIHERYHPKVKDRLLYKVEMGIVQNVLHEMEDEGIVYDWALMRRTADALRTFRDHWNAEIMAALTELVGQPVAINLASPPQVRKVLFEQLQLSTSVYTDRTRDLPPGQRVMSTGDIALRKLAVDQPVVKKILQWREMTKLLGTYLDKYEAQFNYADDGRAHPNHLSAFVITGRFAVSDPPYQGSPKKYHFDLVAGKAAHEAGEEPSPGTCFKFNFRDCITAPPDHYILGFDLSQAELRAVAGEAQEQALLEAFANGEDVHRVTASAMLGIPLEDITTDHRDVGKAQPLDAGIMTPTGVRRMGDLQVGDFVIGSDGTATKITGVFPQGQKEVFRVTTSDGASTECCGEHLWTVQNINSKGAWITKPLEKLVASGIHQARDKDGKYPQPKYKLPDRQPVIFDPGPELPIDPYVLGALLGDGGFTHSWCASFGSADQELLDAVRTEHERLGGRWASEKETSPGFRVAYLSAGTRFERGTNKIKDALRDLGLWGHRDCDKFVPEMYLHASPEDRLALLQGLLDTDGNVQASGAEFRVTSQHLAEAVQFLARSLGGWASFKSLGVKKTDYHTKSEGRENWCVYLRLPDGLCPFRLSRKIAKWKKPIYKAPQTIISVDAVGVKETQCISVSAGDGLYLTDTFIYSHNTLNFALLYGLSVKGLADRLGIPIEEAQALMDKYFAGMPSIAAYMQKQVAFGQANGFVTSKFGRRLPIWEYKSDKRWIYQKGDRACVNYPIQGAATGDLVKIMMVRVVAAIKKAGLADKIKLVMNVHDALEFYVHTSIEPQVAIAVLKPAVIFPVAGWPPMKADWHIAKRWGSPMEIDVNDDGSITVKGGQTYELAPTVEETDDGDVVEAMPEVDPEAIREAARSTFDTGRQVVVVLRSMPAVDNWRDFMKMLRGSPGPNHVLVVTPEGELSLPFTSAIRPDHLAMVAQLLGDSEMSIAYRADTVADLADGLVL